MSSPLSQFMIKPIVPLYVGGIDLSITNATLFMLIAVTATAILFVLGMRGARLVPKRVQMLAELIHNAILDVVDSNAGEKARPFFPFIFALFLFILFCNLFGMIPGGFTVTSHIVVTFALAILVFLVVTVTGFVRHGLHFLTLFVPKGAPLIMAPFLFILELISFCVRPFSLSIRLFANMLAGHILLKVFAGMSVAFGIGLGFLPLAMNVALTGFEFFVAILQAYIFVILSSVYLHDALEMH